jgi:hypothetical protein
MRARHGSNRGIRYIEYRTSLQHVLAFKGDEMRCGMGIPVEAAGGAREAREALEAVAWARASKLSHAHRRHTFTDSCANFSNPLPATFQFLVRVRQYARTVV